MTSEQAPKRRLAPLAALLVGNGVSGIGNQVSAVAIPWYVLQTTGSASLTGIAAAVNVIPMIVSGALVGTFVDRFGHKRASVLADLASALCTAAIPLMQLTIGLNYPALLVLIFLGALLDVPGIAARQSLAPELAELARIRLARVNAIYSALNRGTGMFGPPLAGVLIVTVGPANALWIDAASFLFSAAVVGVLIPKLHAARPAAKRYVDDLRAGIRLLRDDKLIRLILVSIAASNFLVSPIFAVLLPAYGISVLGDPLSLGLLYAAFAGGAVVGALLYGAFAARVPRRVLFMWTFALSGVPFGLLGLTREPLVAALVLAFIGLAAGPINPLIATVVQEHTAPQFRARVFGGVIAVAWIAMPFGMLAAGAAVDRLGVELTMRAIGIAFVVLVLLGVRLSGLREFDTPRPKVMGAAP
ncbi:MAG TPA: MFS transporter [Candidatus Limnocylindria bacterium]|jgi:MFS family permease